MGWPASTARGHTRGQPQGSGIVGEGGRLLVALLGLADQVAVEGQAGEQQSQPVRVGTLVGSVGGPAQGRPQVVGDRVEPGPPAFLP
ncbi:hypothetical protein OHA21_16090 [Actinoplanes sp. NBC_00393]|uniref:hypothetical protein n=1 Tax=Actinoplanes sp. NBC_00393 TaxID=2975953 RepID=UPI002E1B4D35